MKPRQQASTYLWSRCRMSETQTSCEELAPLHPDADGFTLFRILPNGEGRAYTGVEFTDGWKGANRFLRRLRAFGYVRNSSTAPDGYHVLDVLNANGDIVQDYAVPPHPSRAFAYIKRKLQLRVVTPDVPAASVGESPAVAS